MGSEMCIRDRLCTRQAEKLFIQATYSQHHKTYQSCHDTPQRLFFESRNRISIIYLAQKLSLLRLSAPPHRNRTFLAYFNNLDTQRSPTAHDRTATRYYRLPSIRFIVTATSIKQASHLRRWLALRHQPRSVYNRSYCEHLSSTEHFSVQVRRQQALVLTAPST